MSTSPHSLSIVIPCLNEEAAVDDVLGRLQKLRARLLEEKRLSMFEVIVVDDGSTDRSVERISNFPWTRIICHDQSRGYGASLKTGFAAAQGEWIGCLDMDSTYNPLDLELYLPQTRSAQTDIVFGIRPFWGKGMPAIRGVGNFLFSWIVRMVFGRGVDDIATGMRIFHRRKLDEVLSLPHDRFDFGFSFTIWALVKKWRIRQVGISYLERKGPSKLNSFRDGLVFFRVVFELIRIRVS